MSENKNFQNVIEYSDAQPGTGGSNDSVDLSYIKKFKLQFRMNLKNPFILPLKKRKFKRNFEFMGLNLKLIVT